MASSGLDQLDQQANSDPLDELASQASQAPPAPKKKPMPPYAKLGQAGLQMASGTLRDVFGLLTLPYTAALKTPGPFEQELKRRGIALGASIPAAAIGEMSPAGPIGAGALGSAVYSAMSSPGDKPLDTALAAIGGGVLGSLFPHAPSDVPVPTEGNVHPTVARLTEAIKAAGPVREKQQAGYAQALGPKFAAASQARAATGGEAGAIAAKQQMSGELPKVKWESVRDQFSQGEIDDLFNIIGKSGFSEGDKMSADSGLRKLLGIGGFEVPQRAELQKLNTLFGRDFTDAALSKRDLMQKVGAHIGEALNIPRAVMSSFDLSAPGRQGILMVSRPEFWNALGPMVKSFGSESFYKSVMNDIVSRPSYEHMRIGKLALAEMGEASAVREEAFRSTMAEKIPIAGKVIMASERAYTGFLNKLRADTFDSVLKQDKSAGINVNDPEYLRGLGTWINTFTGRGNLPKVLNEMSGPLGTAFFSPRLQAARINTLNPVFYQNLPASVRTEAIKTGMYSAGSLVTLLGLASLAPGVKVGTDPRSAEFGKIRMGKTRIDILAGTQQPVKLYAQLLSDKIVSSTTGREFTPDNHQLDILGNYLESKTSPIASFLLGMAQHKNNLGQPFDLTQEVMSRTIPLAWQDTWDAVKEYGPEGFAVTPLTIAGVGVQTYGRSVKPFTYRSNNLSMKVTVNPNVAGVFADDLDRSDKALTTALLATPGFHSLPKDAQDKRMKSLLDRGRKAVEQKWLQANAKYFSNGSIELQEAPK